jgi:hypothetical protein
MWTLEQAERRYQVWAVMLWRPDQFPVTRPLTRSEVESVLTQLADEAGIRYEIRPVPDLGRS